jgi:DNA-binding FadR family transcriptional regulator
METCRTGSGEAGEAAVVEAGSRVAAATAAVAGHIREQGLGPGDALPSEQDFARRLGVSRAVVREAFRALAAQRLIDLGAGRRARVAPLDLSAMAAITVQGFETGQITIGQIYDVRRAIETRIAQLAALRRTEAEAARLEALAAQMRDRFTEPAAVMEADVALHETLARASRNPVFGLIVGAFGDVTRRSWSVGWRSRPDDAARRRSVEIHLGLAAAVRAGDPAEAAALMRRHFDESAAALLAAGLG